jgi:hypothetical protein
MKLRLCLSNLLFETAVDFHHLGGPAIMYFHVATKRSVVYCADLVTRKGYVC